MACVTVMIVVSAQSHSQPAQGATLSSGSIFKGSPKVVERRLCLAIPNSAVAPLYSVKVGPPKTGFEGSTCDFVPVGMSVSDDDASPLFVEIGVNDYGSIYGELNKDDHKLSGIGDKSYWDSQAPGMDAPQFVAEKGEIDCLVTTNGEVDQGLAPDDQRRGCRPAVIDGVGIEWDDGGLCSRAGEQWAYGHGCRSQRGKADTGDSFHSATFP
jgi:hypothetical protein